MAVYIFTKALNAFSYIYKLLKFIPDLKIQLHFGFEQNLNISALKSAFSVHCSLLLATSWRIFLCVQEWARSEPIWKILRGVIHAQQVHKLTRLGHTHQHPYRNNSGWGGTREAESWNKNLPNPDSSSAAIRVYWRYFLLGTQKVWITTLQAMSYNEIFQSTQYPL